MKTFRTPILGVGPAIAAFFLACGIVACGGDKSVAPAAPPIPVVRIVTFGDSHVDCGIRGDHIVDVSYISQDMMHAGVRSVASPNSLAGRLEALSTSSLKIKAVNHGIGGTSSDASWRFDGEPNALAVWKGITRFEAEVLGRGGPDWDAGTGKPRVYAYTPDANDFVFISLGSIDPPIYIDSASTHRNIRRMVSLWKGAGLPASHFFMATVPPTTQLARDFPGKFLQLNAVIWAVGAEDGITIIDIAAKTTVASDQWIPGATIDGMHMSDANYDWLASEVRANILRLRAEVKT